MNVTAYFRSHDIGSSDVGPFILIHILSAVLVGSTWALCYWGAGRPLTSNASTLQLMNNEQIPQSMLLNSLLRMPMVSDGIKRKASSALLKVERASKNSKPVIYIQQKVPSLDLTRLCVSYTEAKFGRLFFKPITIPGRIWLSWKGTKLIQNVCSDKDDTNTKKKPTAFIHKKG